MPRVKILSTVDATAPVPTTPTIADSRSFLSAISVAISATRGYENSEGKRVLWINMMAMITDCNEYRLRSVRQGFVHYTPRLVCTDHGLAVLTVHDHQVSVNLLVPTHRRNAHDLYLHVDAMLRETWSTYAVDLRPLESLMPVPTHTTRPRRTIPSARCARDAMISEDGTHVLCYGRAAPVVARLTHARDVGAYTPIARMHRNDPEDTVYWHRFACGGIVAFTNPWVAMLQPLDLPPCLTDNNVTSILTPCCRHFVRSLVPVELADCLDMMHERWVPIEMRRFCAGIAKANFGISDMLIVGTAITLDRESNTDDTGDLVREMCVVYRLFQELHRVRHPYRIAQAIFDTLEQAQDQRAWRKWLMQSGLVYALIDLVEVEHLERLCMRFPPLYHAVCFLLRGTMKEWTPSRVQKANMVLRSGLEPVDDHDPIHAVRANVYALVVSSEAASVRLVKELDTVLPSPPAAPRPAPSSQLLAKRTTRRAVPWTSGDRVVRGAMDTTTTGATHEGVLRVLADDVLQGRFECELVGSGVFFDNSDADVVVTVPYAETLHDAYAMVMQTLPGWTLGCDAVTDEHVSVVRGFVGTVPVDLQVWRGHDKKNITPAERDTARALEFARAVASGATRPQRRAISALHALFKDIGGKGHMMCRLPGVAVTALAVVLAPDDVASMTFSVSLVARLRDVCAHVEPQVDFDTQSADVGRTVDRPTAALRVVLQEVNVASRLTTGVTRHLVDALTHALSLMRSGAVVTSELFAQWRAKTMLCVMRVVPRDADATRSASFFLHTSIAQLDGHPFLDAVYVEDGDDNNLCVRATLSAHANAARYGFRATDVMVRETDRTVRVTRGQRTWTLGAELRPVDDTSVARDIVACTSVPQLVRVDALYETCVPNAPHLRVDVAACFDSRHWRILEDEGGLCV